MEYFSLIITSPSESAEALIRKLADLGAGGFVEEADNIIAYFPGSADIVKLRTELEAFRIILSNSGLDQNFSYTEAPVPDQDWNEQWKKSFTPIDIGKGFTIIPSWLENATDRIPLIIDPGMVFGTGHHESTRMCLELLERLSEGRQKEDFLDIGTGTGILAIAAKRLGYKNITAIDIDPLCIDATQRNMHANGFEGFRISEGGIETVDGSFDFIAANLISEVLVSIAADLARRLRPGGITVMSGMLDGQQEEVSAAARKAGLAIKETVFDGKWVSLVCGN